MNATTTNDPTLTLRLLEALAARGATEIFGIPGDFAIPMFREFERLGILPLYTFSHEPAVGFAADAAARARGGLGVAAVTYGAGAFNIVNAVACAYAERVPLVVLSGAPAAREAASGLLLHHQVKTLDSQWRVFEELTVARARLDDPRTAPDRIAEVLDAALSRSRPVYLEVPRDMPAVACEAVPPRRARPVDSDRLAACADELLARLRAASRPVLMVGIEVRRFGIEHAVAELARRLGIPVVTNLMGQGLLAEEDITTGVYLGLAGDPEVCEHVEHSDALFLLGVIVSDTDFAVSAKRIDLRHAIHVYDGDVAMGHHVYHDLPMHELVDALLERLPPGATARIRAGTESVRSTATNVVAANMDPDVATVAPAVSQAHAADATLTPYDIAEAVKALTQRTGAMPIACDVGDCLFTALGIPRTPIVAPGYYAGMGYGVPAGMGLQVSTGQRPIVLVGDGAFEMTGWELGNAARFGCDPIVIILNNASWEMLRTFDPGARFNDLTRWDFASMAAGMGGDGYAVHTREEFVSALDRAATTRGRFQLIDARIERGHISPTRSAL